MKRSTRQYAPPVVGPIKVGMLFEHNGQHYFCREIRQGKPSTLLVLESLCAECRRPFLITVGRRTFYYNKRCDAHKRKGVKAVSDTIFD